MERSDNYEQLYQQRTDMYSELQQLVVKKLMLMHFPSVIEHKYENSLQSKLTLQQMSSLALSLCIDIHLARICFVAGLEDLEAANCQLQQELDELSQSSVSALF